MTMLTSNESTADLQERFRWLKENERANYQCPDYAISVHPSNCTNDFHLRSDRVLEFRHHTLLQLYDHTDRLGIDRSVMSTAAFIFDRYLSTFTPNYNRREAAFPCRKNLIGVASLFIAAKSLMAREEFHIIAKNFDHYSTQVFAEQVELKILKALDWHVVYHSPCAIVCDLLTLLPRPRGYQEYDISFEAYLHGILNETSHLTKLASVTYGFHVNFPPTTIALAALMVATENQPPSVNIAIFKLISPIRHCMILIEQFKLGLSVYDEDVLNCRQRFLHLLKMSPKHESSTKIPAQGSPTNGTQEVSSSADVHSISP